MPLNLADKAIILTLGTVTAIGIVSLYEYDRKKTQYYNEALNHCRAVGKPLLNAGCGFNPNYIGDINYDLIPKEKALLPNYQEGNVENMPFGDKQFGAVICYDTIEHVDNPKQALAELQRVADKVYIVSPHFWDFLAVFYSTHKWWYYPEQAIRINPLVFWALLGGGLLTYIFLIRPKIEGSK